MSTDVEAPGESIPTLTKWRPEPSSLYRLSVDQYEELVRTGVFTKRDRFHLINGFMVAKLTEHPPHLAVCEAVRAAIEAILPGGWHARSERPLRIPAASSVPEPDLTIARGSIWDFEDRHPEPIDVALVVEVANTSVRVDRELAAIYALGGVASYWIVKLDDRQIEAYSDPSPQGYKTSEIHKCGQAVPVRIDGAEVGKLVVADVMPRRV